MLLPGREWQEGYRFAFNGKEQDPEQLGQGNIYDYGFRIYDPRLGKFLSVDPLTSQYSYYSSYQYAGSSPIKYIDVDGLEKGELDVTSYSSKLANLTWYKIYHIVNSGYGAVQSPQKLTSTQFQSDLKYVFDHGENKIYVDRLPLIENPDCSFSAQSVKRKSKRAWEKGKAWEITILWDIQIIDDPNGYLLQDVNNAPQTDYPLNGYILDESGKPGLTISMPEVAKGTVNLADGIDLIYLNDEVFGIKPISITVSTHGANEADLIGHEIGHNFGLSHPDPITEGYDYSYSGLMNNKHDEIRPTKEDNIEIINSNAKNIQLKQ